LRPCPGHSILHGPREAAVGLYLHRMVIRTGGEFLQRDIAVAGIRSKEVGRQGPARRSRILICGLEVSPIRNLVDVSVPGQMPSDRTYIGDVENSAKADGLLNSEAPVHDRGYFARLGDSVDRCRELRLL